MNRLITFLLAVLLLSGCSSNEDQKSKPDSETHKQTVEDDTIPKVTGIGGIFFKSKNTAALKEWYGKNLRLSTDNYGSVFEFRNAKNPEQENYLRWSLFEEKTDYFDPSKKEFMINYRVQNLEGLVKILKANSVTVLDSIANYEYGKFVHIMDLEGNKIELWEPVDSVLTKLGGVTTK
jgi:predicted enzyme related to lactoylglutathione lyase